MSKFSWIRYGPSLGDLLREGAVGRKKRREEVLVTMDMEPEAVLKMELAIQRGHAVTCPLLDVPMRAVRVESIEFIRVGVIRVEVLFR